MSNEARNAKLRQLINDEKILVVPGVTDPYLAKLVEKTGFDAVYMTGAGVSHTRLGMPDLGLLTFSEMVDQASRIADAVDIPLIADADTGYGNALNVQRTIRAYERAGVSACHIEDQDMPKRCGHFDEKTVVPLREMLGKLKAALDARIDPNFLVIARTDARTAVGFDEALERGLAFADVGADIVFVESPTSKEELATVGQTIKHPLLANMVETGLTPLLPAAELQALGFNIAIHPGAIGRFIGKQVSEFLAQVLEEGSTLGQLDRMLDFKAQNAIVDLPAYLETAARYKDE
ncbi:MAG: isocitrate lyase/PEP mutase family protein [Gammaproteobacteria bacterium]|nr:isocitrate lyase/PEP mutase family protein [Gammaproteobacteria bacterium]